MSWQESCSHHLAGAAHESKVTMLLRLNRLGKVSRGLLAKQGLVTRVGSVVQVGMRLIT